MNICVNSIITANKPTFQHRIYRHVDLIRMYDYIHKKIFTEHKDIIFFGNVIPDDISLSEGHGCGVIKSCRYDTDHVVFDIELVDGQYKQQIKELYDKNLLRVDFYLDAKQSLDCDIYGNHFVDLTNFSIKGLRLVQVNQ